MTTISNIEFLDGNPDGSVWSSEFDEAVWKASRNLAPVLHYHITEVNKKTIPSKYWLASLIQAFTSVAYKNKKEYNRSEFTSWWLPMIKAENPMLDNITKIMYPNKFDRGIGGLRELREQGKVPDIIWKPWAIKSYAHTPVGPMDKLIELLKKGGWIIIGGIAVYFLLPVAIREFRRKPKESKYAV